MKQRVLVTNGGLGTDNQLVIRYNINSWQGMRQVIYWTTWLAAKTGKDTWAQTWPEGTFDEKAGRVLIRITR